jgi:hypothetical protein
MMCITVSQPVERESGRSETATFAKEVHRTTGQPELRLRRAEQGDIVTSRAGVATKSDGPFRHYWRVFLRRCSAHISSSVSSDE